MKALIVDDSDAMRRILMQSLIQAGIKEFGQAADGLEAVAEVEKNPYDLVLMDWNMPKMSGLEALKKIRDLGKTMPVIMVTTEAEKGRIIEALKAGANNYIVKPFKPETIIIRIQETLGKK